MCLDISSHRIGAENAQELWLSLSCCHAVHAELGLRVSIGVAPNKLLAKLASQRCKPDGVLAVSDAAAAQELLVAMPIKRLPGCGGKRTPWFGRACRPSQTCR